MGKIWAGRDVLLPLAKPVGRRDDARDLRHLVERIATVARRGVLDAVFDVPAQIRDA